METTINIKLDEEQVEAIVKKVTENIIKKANEDLTTVLIAEKPNKFVRMYLEANESDLNSEVMRVYWGGIYNTLDKELASYFNLENKRERTEVEGIKNQGWKEEVFYK